MKKLLSIVTLSSLFLAACGDDGAKEGAAGVKNKLEGIQAEGKQLMVNYLTFNSPTVGRTYDVIG